MTYFYYTILAIISYFIGNISPARIISKFKHDDITKLGSGNPGTSNMWRNYGFFAGVWTYIFDALKGVIPSLLAYLFMGKLGCNPEVALYVAGFSVVLGHVYPVFYKFKGGKGIATASGVFLVANPLMFLIVWLCVNVLLFTIKYASLSNMLGALACCVVEAILCSPANWVNYIFLFGILFLIVYSHRSNIERLIHHKESKIYMWDMIKKAFKKKPKQETNVKQNVEVENKE